MSTDPYSQLASLLPDGDPWPTHIHGLARWVRKVRLVEPEWREATP